MHINTGCGLKISRNLEVNTKKVVLVIRNLFFQGQCVHCTCNIIIFNRFQKLYNLNDVLRNEYTFASMRPEFFFNHSRDSFWQYNYTSDLWTNNNPESFRILQWVFEDLEFKPEGSIPLREKTHGDKNLVNGSAAWARDTSENMYW